MPSSSTITRPTTRSSLTYYKYVAVHAALFMSGLVLHQQQVPQVQAFGLVSVPSSPSSTSTPSLSSSSRGWHLRPLSTRNQEQNDLSSISMPTSTSTTTALHAAAKLTSSGGRKPGQGDKITTDDSTDVVDDDGAGTVVRQYRPKPAGPSECRLTVIQITDVYTLEHLASLKTLVEDIRAKSPGAKVVCMLTGDFLSPYLLSSVDKGKGMMNALNKIPLDYLTWGNHEADIPNEFLCQHVYNFKGTWLNSNMLDHKAMDGQDEFDVVDLCSPDGTNERKVGLVALLSNDPKLYAHFKGGAFGGATLDDPWETLEKMKIKLMSDDTDPSIKCDTILPLQHLYVPDDYKTCQNFDFPVILSGHDHHRVDEVVDGTRLLKPGMDGIYATVMDMSWSDSTVEGNKPTISARFVKTSDWVPDEKLEEENERAYDVLAPLRNTELAKVPPVFEPLSSSRSRAEVCTMGLYICALLRSSLNLSRNLDQKIDAVLLMGGNIRGGRDYEDGSYFSLEALEEEIKNDEVLGVVPMPGWLLSEGVTATHAGDPIPGWMQYDNGVLEDFENEKILQVGGKPLDPNKVYRVATKISDLTNGQSPPWTKYYKEHPELLPPKGAYINIQAELMSYFAQNLWRRIWESMTEEIGEDCTAKYDEEQEIVLEKDCNPELRLELLDNDGDGVVGVEEIQDALQNIAGINVDPRETTLAEFVHDVADATNSGKVTIEDLEVFCDEMVDITEREKLGQIMSSNSTETVTAEQ
mmetsp:Transcript_22807/g.54034  ORF Transcript_22807/g.54034 Transcript_22807/m.54034 type:complete len:751 (-) Transcript_22807:119-2371(-)